jgi:hypothetical protein
MEYLMMFLVFLLGVCVGVCLMWFLEEREDV